MKSSEYELCRRTFDTHTVSKLQKILYRNKLHVSFVKIEVTHSDSLAIYIKQNYPVKDTYASPKYKTMHNRERTLLHIRQNNVNL